MIDTTAVMRKVVTVLLLTTTPVSIMANNDVSPGYRGVGLKRKRPVGSIYNEPSLLHAMTPDEFSKGKGRGHDKLSSSGDKPVKSRSSSSSTHPQESFEEWLAEGFEVLPDGSERNETTSRRVLNVFNVDDRSLATPEMMDQYPFRCIGQFVRGSSFCTATIIEKNLILTNRHCLGLVGNQLPNGFYSNSRFLSGFSNGQSNFVVSFTEVYWSEEDDDFAILLLSENIGSFTGWPAIIWTFNSYFSQQRNLAMLGYSGDVLQRHNAPSYVESCYSRGVKNGIVLHDCDNTRGSSGSPMFDSFNAEEPTIIAYNDGEFRSGDASEYLEVFAEANANTMKPSGLFRDTYNSLTGVSASTAEEEGLSEAAEFFLYGGIPILLLVFVVLWVRWKNKEEEKNSRKRLAII